MPFQRLMLELDSSESRLHGVLDKSAFAEQDQIRPSLIIHVVTPGLGNQSLHEFVRSSMALDFVIFLIFKMQI